MRRSPIYVDPSLASALPKGRRQALLARMRRSPIRVHVVLVPLVKGGTWEDPDQLLTVVHDRLGRDGAYLSLDDFQDQLAARQWGGTPEQQENTRYAAQVPFFLDEMKDAPLADRLIRAVDLIAAGRGKAEYDAATAHLGRPRPSAGRGGGPVGSDSSSGRGGDDGGGTVPLVLGAAGLGVAAVAGLAVWRWRRTGRVPAPSSHRLPRTVLATALRANEEELREQAAREVVAFGELLDRTDVDASAPRVRALMTEALDAYQAAGKVLDAARGLPDLAGVLVLVDRGLDALASAQSLADGGRETPGSPLCFFNPLHGDSAVTVNWRPLGSRERLRVKACHDCAKAVRARRTPQMLLDRVDGRAVPYYEVDADDSLWARTGYGQLRDDLVQRVLRGDLHR
ncbi:hypothetical protein ABZ801_04985 [Actinomadura sp. NPDC047616]|uniref:hypothetical protein n=1 Tax=Actinomadura sp. NPDC047616 TaxID=3155914 RepID=UPI003402DC97